MSEKNEKVLNDIDNVVDALFDLGAQQSEIMITIPKKDFRRIEEYFRDLESTCKFKFETPFSSSIDYSKERFTPSIKRSNVIFHFEVV